MRSPWRSGRRVATSSPPTGCSDDQPLGLLVGDAEGLRPRLAHARAPLPHLQLPVACAVVADVGLRPLRVMVVTRHPGPTRFVDLIRLETGTQLGSNGV